MKKLIGLVLLIFLLSMNSNFHPRIEGVWINEKDPKLIWEFKVSGQLWEKYGDKLISTSSSYQILDSSTSCSQGTTDAPDQTYVKITDAELGAFCYYLETLSNEVLVLIDADTGRLLIFNRVN